MLRSFEKAAMDANAYARVPSSTAKQKKSTEQMVLKICDRLEKQYRAFRQNMNYREDDKL